MSYENVIGLILSVLLALFLLGAPVSGEVLVSATMSSGLAGIVFLASLVLALALVHVPLGDYMYRVYSSEKHFRAERVIYRSIGADPKAEQT